METSQRSRWGSGNKLLEEYAYNFFAALAMLVSSVLNYKNNSNPLEE